MKPENVSDVTICVKRLQLGIFAQRCWCKRDMYLRQTGNSLSCSIKPAGERIARCGDVHCAEVFGCSSNALSAHTGAIIE